MKKKFLSLVLVLSMFISLIIPVTVAAADELEITAGIRVAYNFNYSEHINNYTYALCKKSGTVDLRLAAAYRINSASVDVTVNWYMNQTDSTEGGTWIISDTDYIIVRSGNYDAEAGTTTYYYYIMTVTDKSSGEVLATRTVGTLAFSVVDHNYTSEVTKEATCTEAGEITYTCTECGETKTETVAATGHSWDEGVVTKAATCTEDGEKTYTCEVCGLTKTETVAATDHSLTHVEVKDATCTEDGNKEYWYCSECGKYFSDSAATAEISQSDTVISAKGHSLTHVEPQEATCTADGNSEYWYCSECGKYFSDSAATAEVSQSDTVISAKGHSLTHVEAREATCTSDGNSEYWYCTECGKYFSDSAATAEISQSDTVIAAKGHSLTHIEAKDATCTANGNKEYWYCSECGKYFSDSSATTEISLSDTVISAKGHSLTHVEAQGATCTSDGNSEYWYCSECGKYFSDSAATAEISQSDTVISAKGHSLTHIEAQAETCTSDGNSEYWYCTECGKYFSDSAATAEISQSDTVIAAKGHSLMHVEAQAETCTLDGNSEYWYCSECGKYFSDSAATAEISQSDTVIAAKGHSLMHVEAQAETCTADGNKEYWYCTECGKYFSDSAATAEISQSDTVIAAKGHSLTHVEAQGATCTSDGNSEYWYCTECGKYFSDSAATAEISQSDTVISAKGHSLTHVEAQGATCTSEGNKEYWYCGECGKYFSDSSATTEISLSDTVISAKGHSLTRVEAKDTTCTSDGNSEYWYCSECGKYFSDSAATAEISQSDTVISAKGHNLTHVEAKAETCTSDGNSEYWYCTECGKYFSDSSATMEIRQSDTVASATGHSWDDGVITTEATATTDGVKTYTCSECGETYTETIAATGGSDDESSTNSETIGTENNSGTTTSPQTGDNSNLWLWIILALFSGSYIICVSSIRRRRNH